MKVSVSLSDDDVEFLDAYASEHGMVSRSAAVQRAVGMLRLTGLSDAYSAAWKEWVAEDDDAWAVTELDNLT
jgi:hypothetical protein